MLDFLLFFTPIFWIAFPLLGQIASTRLNYLYHDPKGEAKAGGKLVKKGWGPSFKNARAIYSNTKDEYTKSRAKLAIRLWKLSYISLIVALLMLTSIFAIRINGG
jgi:hypothetical protein